MSGYSAYDVVAYNALADSFENSNVFGIVESKPTSTTCVVRSGGVSAANYFSLDVEDEYYLSDTYPGLIVPSALKPSVSGRVAVKIGQPYSTSQLVYSRGERKVVA